MKAPKCCERQDLDLVTEDERNDIDRYECQGCGAYVYRVGSQWDVVGVKTVRAARAAEAMVRDPVWDGDE